MLHENIIERGKLWWKCKKRSMNSHVKYVNDLFNTVHLKKFNSFYPRCGHIRPRDHRCCQPGTDISVHSLVIKLRLFLFGAKVFVLTKVSYKHFLNASAQHCSHMLQFSTGFDTHTNLSELLQNSWSEAESVLSAARVKWVKCMSWWAFVWILTLAVGLCLVGLCPAGFCLVGFTPVGFCPHRIGSCVALWAEWNNHAHHFRNNFELISKTGTTVLITSVLTCLS